MKLLNILARELKAWPETTVLAQDSNGHVFGWTGFPNWDGDQWLIDVGVSLDKCRPGEMDLADDHMTASVARAEWQAAVDAIYADEPAELKWPDGSTHFQDADGNRTVPVFWHVVDGVALKAWRMMSDKVTVDATYKYSPEGCPTFNISKCIERPAPKVVEWDGVGLPPVGLKVEGLIDGNGDWREITLKYRSLDFSVFERGDGEEFPLWNPQYSNFRPIRTAEQVSAEEREIGIQAIQDAYTYTVGHSTHKILHSQATRLYDAGCRLQVTP